MAGLRTRGATHPSWSQRAVVTPTAWLWGWRRDVPPGVDEAEEGQGGDRGLRSLMLQGRLYSAREVGGRCCSRNREVGGRCSSRSREIGGRCCSRSREVGGRCCSRGRVVGGRCSSGSREGHGRRSYGELPRCSQLSVLAPGLLSSVLAPAGLLLSVVAPGLLLSVVATPPVLPPSPALCS